MKPIHRWLLGLFLLGLVGGWFVLSRMDGLLRERLVFAGEQALGDRYAITVGELHSRPFSGSLELRGVSILPRGAEPLVEGSYVFQVTADRVALEGLSYWSILVNGILRVDAMRLISPHVDYVYRPAEETDRARVDRPVEHAAMRAKGSVGEVELRDASGLMRRWDRDSAEMSVSDLDVLLSGLHVERDTSGALAWQLNSARIDLHGLAAVMPPLYDARIDTVEMRYPERTARVVSARLLPRSDRHHYGALVEESVELLDVELAELAVERIDLEALLRDRALLLGVVRARGGHLFLDHDGRLPAREDRPRHMPCSGLRSMRALVSIDSLDVRLDSLRYGEHGARTTGYGDVNAEDVRLRAARIRTGGLPVPGDTLGVRVDGSLYGEGAFTAAFRAAYNDKVDRFMATLHLGGMELRRFGALTSDLLNGSPTAGRLQELTLALEGDRVSADMDHLMAYTGLRVSLLPAEGLKGRLLSGVANLAVLDANPLPGKEERRVRKRLYRRPDRTIAAYVVGALKEGALRTLLPPRLADAAMERAK